MLQKSDSGNKLCVVGRFYACGYDLKLKQSMVFKYSHVYVQSKYREGIEDQFM